MIIRLSPIASWTALGCFFGAAAFAGAPPKVQKPLAPASAVRGLPVYLKSCAACHGERGDGQGSAGVNLKPLPRDFTTGIYKFRTTASGELPTDADLLAIVNRGIPGTQMPAWEDLLNAQEKVDVVAYIKSLSPDFEEAAPAPLVIPDAPLATSQSIQEGRMVYMSLECWSCHGGSGRGNGKSAKTLTDDWGHALPPRDLTQARYRAGNDAKSIYRTFSTGLNGTPMPAFAQADFLMGSDAVVDPAKLKEAFGDKDIEKLRAWLRLQPTSSDIGRMREDQQNALAERRKWSLAHYVHSLVKPRNFLVRLFTENTEVTP